MGCLPWAAGILVGAAVYFVTNSIIAGSLSGVVLFFAAWYAAARYGGDSTAGAGSGETKTTSRPSAKRVIFGSRHSTGGKPPGKADFSGLNDALTGEPLSMVSGLYQCQQCQVYYYESSLHFLRKENDGKCVACASTSIVPLGEVDSAKRGKNYEPEAVTLANYEHFANQVVTFEGYVPRINRSRDGKHYAIMFENKPWTDGFRMVVFGHNIKDVGGERFLDGLLGKTIRVRGLLIHGAYGYEIIVNKRSMILAVR